ncbi:hypothetical protein C0J52_27329 [Blattella germanica]|nr:hypothetical protein C0J52_27329 [Blattella germanica]
MAGVDNRTSCRNIFLRFNILTVYGLYNPTTSFVDLLVCGQMLNYAACRHKYSQFQS